MEYETLVAVIESTSRTPILDAFAPVRGGYYILPSEVRFSTLELQLGENDTNVRSLVIKASDKPLVRAGDRIRAYIHANTEEMVRKPESEFKVNLTPEDYVAVSCRPFPKRRQRHELGPKEEPFKIERLDDAGKVLDSYELLKHF
ncbi:MAG: hypothetical protein V1702_00915 [Candidatus Woesearchaeota archaeon]